MSRPSARRLLWPGLTTAAALAILIWLGIWQLRRLAWKTALLADIDRAEQAPAVPLGAGVPSRFTKVVARGMLRPGRALYGADVRDIAGGRTAMGAQSLAILDREGEPPLLVDLGWVPGGTAPPAAAAPATVDGYVRAPEHANWLSAEDSAVALHFYTLDPAGIGAALGAREVAPFTLVALGPPKGAGPVPAEALPRPPNNHLQYALTWFGLAASLAGVFGVWATGKKDPQAGEDWGDSAPPDPGFILSRGVGGRCPPSLSCFP